MEIFSSVGGAVGIAVGEAIITSVLPKKLANIPNFASLGISTSATELNEIIGMVHLIPVRSGASFPSRVGANVRQSDQDVVLRDAVLHAWSEAIGTIWIMSTPMAGFALILTLFMREYSLDRKIVRGGGAEIPGDPERGAVSNDERDLQGPSDDDPEVTPANSAAYPEEKLVMDKEKAEA